MLHYVVIGGHKSVVELLLERGASVHAVHVYGGAGDADVYSEISETLAQNRIRTGAL